MKKEYMKPQAEKVEFDYSENVTASWATTDESNPNWTCGTRYADAANVCGQDGHDISNPFWRCNIK